MTQNDKDLIVAVRKSMEVELPDNVSPDFLKETLSSHINFLIQSDFQKLVYLLYRIDISEIKLKQMLKVNAGIDAGKIIAGLIIERQMQKLKYRQQSGKPGDNIPEEDKW